MIVPKYLWLIYGFGVQDRMLRYNWWGSALFKMP
jgi:hypothetical protein